MTRFPIRPISVALLFVLFGCGGELPPPDDKARIEQAIARFAAEPPPAQIHAIRVRRSSSDRAGDVHVVLDTLRNGHRVLGAEMARHVLKDGKVLTQNFADTSSVHFEDAPATVTEGQAVDLARAAMGDLRARLLSVTPELVYER